MGADGDLPRLPECGELPPPLCLNDLADELLCADDLAGERLALNVTRLLLELALCLPGCALTIARVADVF